MSARTELSALDARYDLIIVGGGITGAGILREAVRTGAKVLLVEQHDFASGTSSWSSKLVHGGLRYLKSGQWRLTLESVRERQRLMREAPGLVEPLRFLMPIYHGRKPGKWIMRIGLWIYDLMARSLRSRWLGLDAVFASAPYLGRENLRGAVAYEDARTDDARLVLRLIFDAMALGAQARNYTQAELLRAEGRVHGVRLKDRLSGAQREISASLVIDATGAWAGQFADVGAPSLRPLRGSHFVFPLAQFPLACAVSWLHPLDGRPVFAYPWEGAVVYGTTDLDHDGAPDAARMDVSEARYLLDGLRAQFPDLKLTLADALCSYSGVRPVVAGGKGDPSAESRESAMWSAPGYVGITGGKLTTFRVTARAVLREAALQHAPLRPATDAGVFDDAGDATRLRGRHGTRAARVQAVAREGELEMIDGTPYLWAELRWALRHESVVHLDDLLMRRTRIGLVSVQGGLALLPPILALCAEELGWDASRCAEEAARYRADWMRQHAPVAA